jgi:hypothetical protein
MKRNELVIGSEYATTSYVQRIRMAEWRWHPGQTWMRHTGCRRRLVVVVDNDDPRVQWQGEFEKAIHDTGGTLDSAHKGAIAILEDEDGRMYGLRLTQIIMPWGEYVDHRRMANRERKERDRAHLERSSRRGKAANALASLVPGVQVRFAVGGGLELSVEDVERITDALGGDN